MAQTHTDNPCRRCDGHGELPQFRHVQNGVCFRCGGSKIDPGPGRRPSRKPVKRLSNKAANLLHALIHTGEGWWRMLGDKAQRKQALDELASHRLVELGKTFKACRATDRGRESNRRWVASASN